LTAYYTSSYEDAYLNVCVAEKIDELFDLGPLMTVEAGCPVLGPQCEQNSAGVLVRMPTLKLTVDKLI